MKKLLAVTALCLAATALARDPAKCKGECKEFVVQCEKTCNEQMKKKNPKAAELCSKNCKDFIKTCEKECDNAKK